MKRYLLALVASLSLAGCASSYTYDPAHSVAYNVVRAGGLRVDDSQALDSHPVAWQTGAVAGGHQGGGALTMGAETAVLAGGGVPALGVLNVLDLLSGPTLPPAEKLPQLIAWVPVSAVRTGVASQSKFPISDTEMTFVYQAIASATANDLPSGLVVRYERSKTGGIGPTLVPSSCAPSVKVPPQPVSSTCDEELPHLWVASAPAKKPPRFLMNFGPVYGPYTARFLFGGSIGAPLNSPEMLLRISTHLPHWAFIYVPATKNSAAYVLQAGHRLELGR